MERLCRRGLKAISGCYAVPAVVLSDAGSVPIAAHEEIEAIFYILRSGCAWRLLTHV
jgi:transposase